MPGGGEPGGATHDRDQDRAVGLLAGLAVAGDLGLGGAQQPDLADDLVGQIRERHRRVGGVELDRRCGRRPPRRRALGAVMAVGGLVDQRAQPGRAGLEQGPGVGVALEHRQIGGPEVPGQRRERHQLVHQVLDPHLVLGGDAGQPVRRAHPPVQCRGLRAGQLQRLQPGRGDQRQPGQGVGVDPVALGVPGEELAQVRGLRRSTPGRRCGRGR